MNEILTAITRFLRAFQLWLIVSPWEHAVRVRCGKHVVRLDPGVHLKLPIIDAIFLQSDRLRTTVLGKQTVTTSDGKTITIVGSIAYCINDIEVLYRTLHHPEDVIRGMALSAIAAWISDHPIDECQPAHLTAIAPMLSLERFGLGQVELFISDFCFAKTYRLIGDYGNYQNGTTLSTDETVTGVKR